MLRHLQIRDFAIIESVELDFQPGLTVLTGETGAGKSILVDALELLAGGRAGADLVRAGAERADVTAAFDVSAVGAVLQHLLDEQSIAAENELLLRRVVGNDGRSRAWLNGQNVPLQVLRAVSELLIDIHGQHEFQSLLRPATQRMLVDGFGKLDGLAAQVRAAHSTWLALLNRALALESAARDQDERVDLLRYQVRELDALQIKSGEVAELLEERGRVLHRSRLSQAARDAAEALYEADDVNAYVLLARAQSALRGVASLDSGLASLAPPLDEASIQIKDAAQRLARYLTSLDVDAGREDAIEKRLAAFEDLARKHHVPVADLGERHQILLQQLGQLENWATDLATVRAQQAAALADYHRLAQQLTAARTTAARALARDVTARMQELGMAGGRLGVEIEPLQDPEPAPHGMDRVTFMVTTNPGQPQRPLAKTASGGELARLSLAVQVSCAADAAPCMVFDEVDAGIGGAVAEIVGRELRALAAGRQILCVTHLPQVASQGHHHLRVAKLTDGRSTRTAVTVLSGETRVAEISRMLGGVEVTARARAHAVEMLDGASAATPSGAGSSSSGTARKAPKSVP
jgi:DNA repair protein RecN (Recombination protein N)